MLLRNAKAAIFNMNEALAKHTLEETNVLSIFYLSGWLYYAQFYLNCKLFLMRVSFYEEINPAASCWVAAAIMNEFFIQFILIMWLCSYMFNLRWLIILEPISQGQTYSISQIRFKNYPNETQSNAFY